MEANPKHSSVLVLHNKSRNYRILTISTKVLTCQMA